MKAEESKNVARIAKTIMQMYQTLKEVLINDPDKFRIAAQGYIDSLEAMKHYDIIEDYSLDSGEIETKGCFQSTPTPYQKPGLIANLGDTTSNSGSIKEPTNSSPHHYLDGKVAALEEVQTLLSEDKELELSINIKDIAEEMKKRGITKVCDGWSDTLLDILEDLYGIETKVMKVMKIPNN